MTEDTARSSNEEREDPENISSGRYHSQDDIHQDNLHDDGPNQDGFSYAGGEISTFMKLVQSLQDRLDAHDV